MCKDIPVEFKTFLDYCRGLEFNAKPDYDYVLNLFYGCMDRHKIDKKNPPLLWTRKAGPLPALKDDMVGVSMNTAWDATPVKNSSEMAVANLSFTPITINKPALAFLAKVEEVVEE